MDSLTEKQENYKDLIFSKLEEKKAMFEKKLKNGLFLKSSNEEYKNSKIEYYTEGIKRIDNALTTEWTKENFSELVDFYNMAKYYPTK